ncbi:MAG: hypothetical protein ACRDMH_17135 [Solirubrobacterales bacterium]
MSSNPVHMPRLRLAGVLLACCLTVLALLSATAMAGTGGTGGTGGPEPTVTGSKAKLRHGLAIAPEKAPWRVKRVIAAANKIAKGHGYCNGGGYSSWKSPCYDCSSAVSYALHGGHLINQAMPPPSLMRWGKRGHGKWISVYANSGHAWMKIAGLRFDTADTRGAGPGWAKGMGWESSQSYATRHRSRF